MPGVVGEQWRYKINQMVHGQAGEKFCFYLPQSQTLSHSEAEVQRNVFKCRTQLNGWWHSAAWAPFQLSFGTTHWSPVYSDLLPLAGKACTGSRSQHFKSCTLTHLESTLHHEGPHKVTSSAAMAPYHHPTLPNSLFSPQYSSLTRYNWLRINKNSQLHLFSETQMSFTIPSTAVASSAQL